MNRILTRKNLSNNLIRFEISTTLPLSTVQPGQYMLSRISEQMPVQTLAVVKTDAQKGTVVVIAPASKAQSGHIGSLEAGSSLYAMQGPHGEALHTGAFGTVVCIAREGGIVALLPVLSALREAGNRVITLLSASTAKDILLEEEVRALSHETVVVTDERSPGVQPGIGGAAAQIWRDTTVNQVIVCGGATLIREAHALATRYQVALQAMMYLDAERETSSGSIFRVTICRSAGGICVDGYNFNAHYPNFEELIRRFEKG